MRVFAVGRLRDGAEAVLFERYNTRLRQPIVVTEIPEQAGPPHEAKRRENLALRAALPERGFVVALDHGGTMPDSVTLASMMQRWQAQASPLCFLIGGAEGLDQETLTRADAVLSFGPMTWPHFLARAMLAEQIYRATTIASGHPYHRRGRPED